MVEAGNKQEPSLRGKRRTLLIMVSVFALPYALAWLLYLKPEILDLGTRNNGTLILPAIGADAYQLIDADGAVYQSGEDNDKWMLMTFGSADCEDICQKNLFTLQQLRRMLGVDRKRLSRAYVLLEATADDTGETTASVNEQLSRFEGTTLFSLQSDSVQSLEQSLELDAGTLVEQLLLADPEGNLVLYFPREMDPREIIEDIQVLFGKKMSF